MSANFPGGPRTPLQRANGPSAEAGLIIIDTIQSNSIHLPWIEHELNILGDISFY